MEFIKIIRLKTGEDIICFVESAKHVIKIVYPILISLSLDEDENQQELSFGFWLPVELLEKNQVTIPLTEILFFATPKKEFIEFYLNYLTQFENEINDNDMTEITNLIDSFDAASTNKLH